MLCMHTALYEALYKSRSVFCWVHFTQHETVPGARSRDYDKDELCTLMKLKVIPKANIGL